MFQKLRLQNKLMLTIMIVFFVMLLSFMLYLYSYMKSSLLKTELAGLVPTTQKISDQVDMLYKQLDYAALGFTNNQENLDVMVEISGAANENDSYVALSRLAHNLNAIYNVVNDLYKVVVFNADKQIFYSYFRADNLVKQIPESYTSSTQMAELFRNDKLVAVLPPHLDAWSTTPEPVISVVRKFSTPYSTDFGMVEIQLPYRSLEQIATIHSQSFDKKIYIFNADGELIFPVLTNTSAHDMNTLKQLKQHIREKTLSNGVLNLEGGSSLISAYTSNYLNWTTVLMDDGVTLQQNLRNYRLTLLMIGLLILFAVVIIYYFAIGKLFKPLLTLTRTVRSVSLNNLTFSPVIDEIRDYDEIMILSRSFEKMIDKLKLAINTEYESRIRSIEANYSALQAQINPHFLFNTLNVIAVHCEETDSMVAADMCYRLSEMMRYSGSSSPPTATLADEIKYSIYYLELMKLHYDESLLYQVSIPDEMTLLHFPKLSLQPFVENAINHGFDTCLPPWHIEIDGQFHGLSDWCIRIKDNGSGFAAEPLEELRNASSAYRDNFMEGKLVANLQVSGMGILNTYARLLTQFGEDFYFDMTNLEPKGSQIVFGVRTTKEGNDISS